MVGIVGPSQHGLVVLPLTDAILSAAGLLSGEAHLVVARDCLEACLLSFHVRFILIDLWRRGRDGFLLLGICDA